MGDWIGSYRAQASREGAQAVCAGVVCEVANVTCGATVSSGPSPVVGFGRWFGVVIVDDVALGTEGSVWVNCRVGVLSAPLGDGRGPGDVDG